MHYRCVFLAEHEVAILNQCCFDIVYNNNESTIVQNPRCKCLLYLGAHIKLGI